MRGLVLDINIQGQFEAMVAQILCGPDWNEFWTTLNLQVLTIPSLGLPLTVRDDILWRICQEQQLLLCTANRNRLGEYSLEETIQIHNQEDSLPVLTISDAYRFGRVRSYTEAVAIRCLEVFMDITFHRGCGRVYVP